LKLIEVAGEASTAGSRDELRRGLLESPEGARVDDIRIEPEEQDFESVNTWL